MKKALNSLSLGESEIIMAVTGLRAAQSIVEDGKSVEEIIADFSLKEDANTHPTVKELIEIWENREQMLREEKIQSTSRIIKKLH